MEKPTPEKMDVLARLVGLESGPVGCALHVQSLFDQTVELQRVIGMPTMFEEAPEPPEGKDLLDRIKVPTVKERVDAIFKESRGSRPAEGQGAAIEAVFEGPDWGAGLSGPGLQEGVGQAMRRRSSGCSATRGATRTWPTFGLKEGHVVPKKLHRELNEQARKKGLKGKARDAYVYGTMEKIKKKGGRKK